MAWNPDTYNQFKTERFAPFADLMALITIRPGMDVIDLGCGTGEGTRQLADALPDSTVLGIDASAEMLRGADAFAREGLTFQQKTIEEQLRSDEQWDLVFSNAAIQWVDDHETLLPALIAMLKPGGQLAIQMPAQPHNLSNRLLTDVAADEPFRTALQDWQRPSPVLTIDTYATLLFANGAQTMTVFEKIYPLILTDVTALVEWVSGTALIPYLERLPEPIRPDFMAQYTRRLGEHFSGSPVFYPFKRILMHATF